MSNLAEDFLVVGDTHLDNRGPGPRTDDFWETSKKRISKIEEIAEENGIETAVCLGDVFNRIELSRNFIAKVMERFLRSNLDWYGLAGNHDEKYQRIDRLENTPIWFLFRSGAVKNVGSQGDGERHREELSERIGMDVVADHYMQEPEFDSPEDSPSILFCHQYSEQMWGSSDHLDEETIEEFSIVFCGHDHEYSKKKIAGTPVVTPGALLRMTARFSNRMRDVIVCKVEQTEDGRSVSSIVVDEGPMEEAYDEDELESMEKSKEMNEYVSTLEDRSDFVDSDSVLDILRSITQDDKVRKVCTQEFEEKGLI